MKGVVAALGRAELAFWRLDQESHSPTWNSGEGAFRVGGRWNSRGVRCVYCSLDESTAILEVAVHKGFTALNAIRHTLTRAEVLDPDEIHVVTPKDIPNPNWLVPGSTSTAQQAFGDSLLSAHKFVAIPSTISRSNWNLIFISEKASGRYAMREQVRFALDPRLDPPVR